MGSYIKINNLCITAMFYVNKSGKSSRDSSSGIALGYGLDGRRFQSRQRLGKFLFTTLSRPTLGPTQPPTQWTPGDLPLEVKLTTHIYLLPR